MVDIKKLKPIGVVMILGLSVLFLIVCFTADFGVPKAYTPAHDAQYYQQNEETLLQLREELEQQEFPRLSGIVSCEPDTESMTLVITVEAGEKLNRAKAVLERDFGEGLFRFAAQEG